MKTYYGPWHSTGSGTVRFVVEKDIPVVEVHPKTGAIKVVLDAEILQALEEDAWAYNTMHHIMRKEKAST